MVPQDAYTACHQIMLIAPNYVAYENANVTYLVTQVAETGMAVSIQGQIVNPAIPEGGSIKDFLDLSLDQQVAILALKDVTEVIARVHKKLEHVAKLSQSKETAKEAAELLQEYFHETNRRHNV